MGQGKENHLTKISALFTKKVAQNSQCTSGVVCGSPQFEQRPGQESDCQEKSFHAKMPLKNVHDSLAT